MISSHYIMRHCMGALSRSRQTMSWGRGALFAHLAEQMQSCITLVFQSSSFSFNYIPLRHTDECPG